MERKYEPGKGLNGSKGISPLTKRALSFNLLKEEKIFPQTDRLSLP
jgi:hypothetical protein